MAAHVTLSLAAFTNRNKNKNTNRDLHVSGIECSSLRRPVLVCVCMFVAFRCVASGMLLKCAENSMTFSLKINFWGVFHDYNTTELPTSIGQRAHLEIALDFVAALFSVHFAHFRVLARLWSSAMRFLGLCSSPLHRVNRIQLFTWDVSIFDFLETAHKHRTNEKWDDLARVRARLCKNELLIIIIINFVWVSSRTIWDTKKKQEDEQKKNVKDRR